MFEQLGRRLRSIFFCAACWVLAPAVSSAGELYLVTRANYFTPHVGCVIRYDDGTVRWLHFRPKPFKKSLLGLYVPGQIDEVGYEDEINHLVGFRVADARLREAENMVRSEFARDSQYRLLTRDCVAFSIVICQAAGLKTKDDHFTPITFFHYVKKNNDFFECAWNVDRDKHGMYTLPWRRNSLSEF